MPQYKDMAGVKSGRLTAISIADSPNPNAKGAYWLCDCECGQQAIIKGAYIRSGVTTSCGCLQKELASLPKGRSEEYLVMYLEGLTAREIADIYELKSVNSVLRELRKYPEYKPNLSAEAATVQFWKQQYHFGMTILDIAKKNGRNSGLMNNILPPGHREMVGESVERNVTFFVQGDSASTIV